jgi:hypothetical protein
MELEIEINGRKNECLVFRPLQRRLRGRFDLNRVAEPMARMKVREWPEPIPGQILGIDTKTGVGYLREPLHDPAHTVTREKIEASGMKLPPVEERFENIHIPTWLFWMTRAVEGKLANIITGELPSDIGGEPQKSFITKPRVDKRDALIEKLIAVSQRKVTGIGRRGSIPLTSPRESQASACSEVAITNRDLKAGYRNIDLSWVYRFWRGPNGFNRFAKFRREQTLTN